MYEHYKYTMIFVISKSIPSKKCPSLKFNCARICAKNKPQRNKMKLDIQTILENCPQHLVNKALMIDDYYHQEDGETNCPFRTSSPDRKARPFSFRRSLGDIQQANGK